MFRLEILFRFLIPVKLFSTIFSNLFLHFTFTMYHLLLSSFLVYFLLICCPMLKLLWNIKTSKFFFAVSFLFGLISPYTSKLHNFSCLFQINSLYGCFHTWTLFLIIDSRYWTITHLLLNYNAFAFKWKVV